MNRLSLMLASACFFFGAGCSRSVSYSEPSPVSASGVAQATVKVPTHSNGHTTEQQNVIDRLLMDNEPGSVKHLYVISAYSGQVLLYSPVRGKVTSSGKRLHPTSVNCAVTEGEDFGPHRFGIPVNIGGQTQYTPEVLEDDGTYGKSIEYLYWFSPDGRYHQHYLSGGQIVHVSDQPVAVKNVVINLETATKDAKQPGK